MLDMRLGERTYEHLNDAHHKAWLRLDKNQYGATVRRGWKRGEEEEVERMRRIRRNSEMYIGPHIANAHGAGATKVLPPNIDIGDGGRGFLDVFLDDSISSANSPSNLPGMVTLTMLMKKNDTPNTSFISSGVIEPR